MEASLVSQIIIGTLLQVGVSVGLHLWGKSIARRHPTGTAFWRRLAWAPLVALAMWIVGFNVSIVMLVRSFQRAATVDPAEKATMLAQGISEAMNFTAVVLLPTMALYLFSAVCFLVGWLKATDQSPGATGG
jgi:hypothetical protein